jgi:predicted TIM-barrel fold metal-dependent hydrolase
MPSDHVDQTPQFSAPHFTLPADACDAHAHVFGPYSRFPLGETRSYTSPEASADAHAAMLAKLGFARAVLVQPSAYGVDNRCILDAVARDPRRRRAIGVADGTITDGELAALKAANLAGFRFVELISKRYGGRPKGTSGFAELEQLGGRMREHGLHAQIFSATATFADAAPNLLKLDLPIVLDHMACAGESESGVASPAFQTVLALLREGRIWVKLTVIRRSQLAPFYEDARPFHDAMIAANPDRLLWGTDWPLVNMGERAPDLGVLVDLFAAWVRDPDVKRKILVDNPAALYGFAA